MHIVFTLYDQMTALDLVGPYQVFAGMPGARITLAASSTGPKRTDSGMQITAERALSDIDDADLIVVPGTSRPDAPLADKKLLAWLANADKRTQWTCSVCTGSLVLGAAGLLKGRRATTHWMVLDALREFGAEPTRERVVIDGKLATGAGVSAGIDMALTVVARICGDDVAQAIQLGIEYDPKPPFSIAKPSPALIAATQKMLLEHAPDLTASRAS
jgi:transcriptional regulator GlxA family with amidase domain